MKVGDEVETALGIPAKVQIMGDGEAVQIIYLAGALKGRTVRLSRHSLSVTKEVDGDTPL